MENGRTTGHGARSAFGAGRVNLIGDHTDYAAGLALPMALDLGVTAGFASDPGDRLLIRSDALGEITLPVPSSPAGWKALAAEADNERAWFRLILVALGRAGVAGGGELTFSSTLPIGSGLSSSAALLVALWKLFHPGRAASPWEIAAWCQACEHDIGAPVGLMDPLVSAAGGTGEALLVDFGGETLQPVVLPEMARFVIFDSGEPRQVATSAYAERVKQVRQATEILGPLPQAMEDDLDRLVDDLLVRRARHVITECARVRRCASALGTGDLVVAGRLMTESHHSLAADFEVSTPVLDDLVDRLLATEGVLGARLTGAGFGGCVLALTTSGASPDWSSFVGLRRFGPFGRGVHEHMPAGGRPPR